MATSVVLLSVSDRFTTTKEEAGVQPREVDTEDVGAAVDLLDERAVSLLLTWDNAFDGALINPSFAVALECAPAAGGPWRPFGEALTKGGAFGWLHLDRTPSGDAIGSVVSPDRFVRARYRITANGGKAKGKTRFGLSARAT